MPTRALLVALVVALAACGSSGAASIAADPAATGDAPATADGGAPVGLPGQTAPIPGSVVVQCDKPLDADSTQGYAEQAYPGRTVAELANVKVLFDAPDPWKGRGFPQIMQPTSLYLRDGAVGVVCGKGRSVTLVGP